MKQYYQMYRLERLTDLYIYNTYIHVYTYMYRPNVNVSVLENFTNVENWISFVKCPCIQGFQSANIVIFAMRILLNICIVDVGR